MSDRSTVTATPDPRLADPAWGERPLGMPRLLNVRLLVIVNILAGY